MNTFKTNKPIKQQNNIFQNKQNNYRIYNNKHIIKHEYIQNKQTNKTTE